MELAFVFFRSKEMWGYLHAAGFALEWGEERELYPDVEAQTRRGYLRARVPGEQSLKAP